MSRRQLARTPDNFPQMKYRARKRHYRRMMIEIALVRMTQILSIELPPARSKYAELIRDALGPGTVTPRRRPWYLALEEAEARGARGTTNIYHPPALRPSDPERVRGYPAEYAVPEWLGTVEGAPLVHLTPIPGGFCVRRLDDHRCLDVLEQLYNQRLVVTYRAADHPHDGREFIEQGWCYYGFGVDDHGTARTKRTAFIAAVVAAHVWDGTGAPPGANKRAGADHATPSIDGNGSEQWH